jgi:hypothetical protein
VPSSNFPLNVNGVGQMTNINFPSFSFTGSALYATQTITGTWSGFSTPIAPTGSVFLTRSGHQITCRITNFLYPSTQTITPTFSINAAQWMPSQDIYIPIIAWDARVPSNYKICALNITSNSIIIKFTDLTAIQTTSGQYAFPSQFTNASDCVVSWSLY